MTKNTVHQAYSTRNEFENTIKDVELLNPKKQKKEIVFWTIRTIFSIILYLFFWKYVWVRYTLFLTVPLTLFSLFSCTLLPYIMQRKVENARKMITEMEENTELMDLDVE